MELSENKNTEMFKKNLKTKKDQDQTTDKLSFTFVSASEKVSDNNSDNGDNHSRDSNDGDCFYDRSIKEGEGDTDGKCVNAGSNSENEHIFVIERCIHDVDGFFFVPFPDGLDHHFAADKAEQDKWKTYADEIEISIETPSGEKLPGLSGKIGTKRYRAGETDLLIYYGKPGPFQVTQEIYFEFIPTGTYLTSGIWKLYLHGRRIKEGNYNLWLPGGNILNPVTGFYRPIAEETLTIPSTAARVITVGAYDSRLNAFADFSGRGGKQLVYFKPDLVAPGVDVTAPVPGGGYSGVTGTSFAVPFVTGAAALMMEWGIVRKNDPFLWGEKVKAYLRRGAQPLPGFEQYPNASTGWGEDVIIRLH